MKYNKSEIMSKAWSLVRRFPNKYNMSSALKKAWARAKVRMAEDLETLKAEKAAAERAARIAADPICSKLVAAGGKLWENYGKRRVYLNRNEILNVCAGVFDFQFYKTGNISGASANGEAISNSRARDLLSVIDKGVYYDIDTGKFVGSYCINREASWVDVVLNAVKNAVVA